VILARRLVPLALVVALAGALLAGCGSGGGHADVQALLSQTFGPDKPVHSGRLDLRLEVDAQGLQSFQGPLAIHLAGPFQSQGTGKVPKFDFDVAFATGGSTLRAGAISTGDKGYLTLQNRAYQLSDQLFKRLQQSRKAALPAGQAKQQAPTLQALGIDPRRWLRNARRVGEEDAGGVRTVHLAAGIDVPRFLADVNTLLGKAGRLGVTGATNGVPSSLTAAQRDKIARSIQDAKVDVWTGKDDRALRRLAIDVRFDVPADVRAKGTPAQKGRVRFELGIADLNKPQAVGPPANPRPLSELTAALQQALGSAQASGSQAGGSSAGSGAASYDQCVAAAGADLAKEQQCAALLGR
jgi:hypothetical protein